MTKAIRRIAAERFDTKLPDAGALLDGEHLIRQLLEDAEYQDVQVQVLLLLYHAVWTDSGLLQAHITMTKIQCEQQSKGLEGTTAEWWVRHVTRN